jgi:copper(I)-binding protein
MSILTRAAAAALISAAFVLPAAAQEAAVGDIAISKAWTRVTPPGAKVGGGFMLLTNKGKAADRLVAMSSDIAEKGEVHETTMTDGVMKMREVAKGLEIPAGGSVELKPGSYHIMFMGLKKPIAAGETVKAKLKFEKAGEVTVDLPAQAMGAGMPAGGHGQMKH